MIDVTQRRLENVLSKFGITKTNAIIYYKTLKWYNSFPYDPIYVEGRLYHISDNLHEWGFLERLSVPKFDLHGNFAGTITYFSRINPAHHNLYNFGHSVIGDIEKIELK